MTNYRTAAHREPTCKSCDFRKLITNTKTDFICTLRHLPRVVQLNMTCDRHCPCTPHPNEAH